MLCGVQLWKDGPYWAECNVGAEKPEDAGLYFQWGEVKGFRYINGTWIAESGEAVDCPFPQETSQACGKGKKGLRANGYTDANGNLTAEHDAATAHLGAPWRMPTQDEIDDLVKNCDTEWTERNGVKGCLVKGRGDYAPRSIFLPAAGVGSISYLYCLGALGRYWSSTPYSDSSDYAWYLNFDSGDFSRRYNYRYYGQSVRPVRGFAK